MLNSAPYWIHWDVPENRDIALLRPATLPKGKRFETEDDVYEIADTIVPKLEGCLRSIAKSVDNCSTGVKTNGVKNCLLPICPICARHYRRYFISEILRIYEENPNGAQTATVYLGEYETGSLKNVSLKTAQDRFRKQLHRSDFGGAIMIGGTEVTYRPKRKDWLLHLHLLSLGTSARAWDNLEQRMLKYPTHDPLLIEPVDDPIEQLSYLQKFHTYYRAGKPKGKKRPRPYPLGKPQLCELASWKCAHEFTDFTFLLGVKRRHGHFCKI